MVGARRCIDQVHVIYVLLPALIDVIWYLCMRVRSGECIERGEITGDDLLVVISES